MSSAWIASTGARELGWLRRRRRWSAGRAWGLAVCTARCGTTRPAAGRKSGSSARHARARAGSRTMRARNARRLAVGPFRAGAELAANVGAFAGPASGVAGARTVENLSGGRRNQASWAPPANGLDPARRVWSGHLRADEPWTCRPERGSRDRSPPTSAAESAPTRKTMTRLGQRYSGHTQEPLHLGP